MKYKFSNFIELAPLAVLFFMTMNLMFEYLVFNAANFRMNITKKKRKDIERMCRWPFKTSHAFINMYCMLQHEAILCSLESRHILSLKS